MGNAPVVHEVVTSVQSLGDVTSEGHDGRAGELASRGRSAPWRSAQADPRPAPKANPTWLLGVGSQDRLMVIKSERGACGGEGV